MVVTSAHKIIIFLGFLSVIHAAYSAAQRFVVFDKSCDTLFIKSLLIFIIVTCLIFVDRSYLRITEQEFTTLPIDIIIQGILSLFVIMYGVMFIAGDFKEIRAVVDLENKSWETLRNLPSFQVFNHRGKAMSPDFCF